MFRAIVVVPILLAATAGAQHGMVTFHFPRWSPDGQWLVFTTNVDGDDEEVWVLSRDGAVKRKLTNNTVEETAADWHADGRRIVFQRHDAGGVEHFAMDADGSNVAPYEPGPARAINGLSAHERRTGAGQAVVVTRAGAGERRVSTVTWAEQPSVSPDGRQVVFEQRDSVHAILSSDIALWDARTDRVRIVARGTDPSWSPDGRTLLFKTPRGPDNALFIATMALPDGEPRVLARGVHGQFSPDGTSIVFMTDGPDRADISVIRTDGTGKRCLTCSWK